MIIPWQKDDALLADIETARQQDGFHLWWLGQSGFLVAWQGQCLLLDPYLSDSLSDKYASTDKPHIRMTEQVIDPARLDFVDLVTSSHSHTDHLDAATLQPLLQANPDMEIVVPASQQQFAAERLQLDAGRLQSLDAGQQLTLGHFTLHAVPAAHDELERDDQGRYEFLGYVVTFADWSIYHSGDTLLYDGLLDALRPFDLDLAMLPINGRAAERRVAGNLWGREAAWLAERADIDILVPCHYDMFTFNTETPDELLREAAALGRAVTVLECGQRYSNSQSGVTRR